MTKSCTSYLEELPKEVTCRVAAFLTPAEAVNLRESCPRVSQSYRLSRIEPQTYTDFRVSLRDIHRFMMMRVQGNPLFDHDDENPDSHKRRYRPFRITPVLLDRVHSVRVHVALSNGREPRRPSTSSPHTGRFWITGHPLDCVKPIFSQGRVVYDSKSLETDDNDQNNRHFHDFRAFHIQFKPLQGETYHFWYHGGPTPTAGLRFHRIKTSVVIFDDMDGNYAHNFNMICGTEGSYPTQPNDKFNRDLLLGVTRTVLALLERGEETSSSPLVGPLRERGIAINPSALQALEDILLKLQSLNNLPDTTVPVPPEESPRQNPRDGGVRNNRGLHFLFGGNREQPEMVNLRVGQQDIVNRPEQNVENGAQLRGGSNIEHPIGGPDLVGIARPPRLIEAPFLQFDFNLFPDHPHPLIRFARSPVRNAGDDTVGIREFRDFIREQSLVMERLSNDIIQREEQLVRDRQRALDVPVQRLRSRVREALFRERQRLANWLEATVLPNDVNNLMRQVRRNVSRFESHLASVSRQERRTAALNLNAGRIELFQPGQMNPVRDYPNLYDRFNVDRPSENMARAEAIPPRASRSFRSAMAGRNPRSTDTLPGRQAAPPIAQSTESNHTLEGGPSNELVDEFRQFSERFRERDRLGREAENPPDPQEGSDDSNHVFPARTRTVHSSRLRLSMRLSTLRRRNPDRDLQDLV